LQKTVFITVSICFLGYTYLKKICNTGWAKKWEHDYDCQQNDLGLHFIYAVDDQWLRRLKLIFTSTRWTS